MSTSKLSALILGSLLALGATSSFAQNYYPPQQNGGGGPMVNDPMGRAAPMEPRGNERGTAYGAGGTAGTHPTGANVGPGRAGMNHASQ
jgi:hypothetical protein